MVRNFILNVFRGFEIYRGKIIDINSLLRYFIANNNSVVLIKVLGIEVYVRKGTPDLKVAVSCLNGEFEILRYVFPSDYSGTFIDAGGYIGTATIALRKLYPNSKIIVIEPSIENIFMLKKNLTSISGVRIVHGALVGGNQKVLKLKNRNTGHWGYTVVANPKDSPERQDLHEVKAYRIGDLVNVNEEVGLLKMDIEGGELDLFQNDSESLKRIDFIFTELHDDIVQGCKDAFFEFSKNRLIIKDIGEKYLSVNR